LIDKFLISQNYIALSSINSGFFRRVGFSFRRSELVSEGI